jgi:hypothetical protein
MKLKVTTLAILAIGTTMAAPANAIVIDNGIASGTLGSWSVDVLGGGQSVDATITALRADNNTLTTSEVVFDYATLLKIGNTVIQLDTSGESLVGGNVQSSGDILGNNGNVINWSVVSSIAPGSPILTNTFTFSSTSPLGELDLYQYLDEDVTNPADVFFTRGTAGSGDLQLYTISNAEGYGISQSGALIGAQGLVNASFTGWAVNVCCGLDVYQPFSPAGVFGTGIDPTTNPFVNGTVYGPTDITSALAWTVDPNSNTATIITTLGGLPDITVLPPPSEVPEAPTFALLGLGLAALAYRRRKMA